MARRIEDTDLVYDGSGRCVVRLEEGDSAWNPASTSSRFWGPATVVYTRYQDGGIEVMYITVPDAEVTPVKDGKEG